MTIGGTILKVEDLANALQVCFDAGAKRFYFLSNATDIATVPAELFAKFQTSFYTSPEDAAIKALALNKIMEDIISPKSFISYAWTSENTQRGFMTLFGD